MYNKNTATVNENAWNMEKHIAHITVSVLVITQSVNVLTSNITFAYKLGFLF